MEEDKKIFFRLDYRLLTKLTNYNNRHFLRIGHQRNSSKVGGEIVVYIPRWFREECCIKGNHDYFFAKVELRDDGIYLYPIG